MALQLLGRSGLLKVVEDVVYPHLTPRMLHTFRRQDSEVERFVRDLRVHQILEGTNEIMRHVVGRGLVAD
jgi:alkylation response protein AidB-like acyl-CoA dehydrogenase